MEPTLEEELPRAPSARESTPSTLPSLLSSMRKVCQPFSFISTRRERGGKGRGKGGGGEGNGGEEQRESDSTEIV